MGRLLAAQIPSHRRVREVAAATRRSTETANRQLLKHAAHVQKTHTQPFTGRSTTNTSDTNTALDTRPEGSLYTVRTNDGISSVLCELSITFCVQ